MVRVRVKAGVRVSGLIFQRFYKWVRYYFIISMLWWCYDTLWFVFATEFLPSLRFLKQNLRIRLLRLVLLLPRIV